MVAYRQTLSKPVEIETRYIKQTGGRGKFAVIYCRFEPLTKEQIEEWTAYQEEQGEKPDPNNIYFVDKIVGGVVPSEYIPSVEQGFREATVKGAKYGFQCVDMQCTLLDGKYHDVDSSQDAFKLAAMECTRDAMVKAGITLLEPIMNVVVMAPEKYQGDLAGDINRRRGEILNFTSRQGPLPDPRLHPAGGAVRLHQRSAQRRPAARRRSRWSRATTPRSRKSWPTCGRRADSCDTLCAQKKQPSESSQRRRIAMAVFPADMGDMPMACLPPPSRLDAHQGAMQPITASCAANATRSQSITPLP